MRAKISIRRTHVIPELEHPQGIEFYKERGRVKVGEGEGCALFLSMCVGVMGVDVQRRKGEESPLKSRPIWNYKNALTGISTTDDSDSVLRFGPRRSPYRPHADGPILDFTV